MGAFELGFTKAYDKANTNTAYSRQLQDEQRQQNLQRNWGILNDPSATPELKQAAGQDIQNQYPTPEHKGTFLSDILHIHSNQKSAQPIAPPPADAPDNPISGAVPAPAPTSDQGGKDEIGVPFSFGAPPAASTPPAPGPSKQGASPSPSPSATTPNLSTVAAAQTPQDAMNLWKQYRGPIAVNEDIAQQRAKAAAGYAQDLEAKRAQAAIELAKTRGNLGIGITPENRFLNQYAAQHGYGSAAEMNADETGEAMKAYRASNATPGWKVVPRGNDLYAVDSHNQNDPGRLIGHKDDMVVQHTFKQQQNADGSTQLVPVTTYTQKGSSQPMLETVDDAPSNPVSANTPSAPPGNSSATQTTSAGGASASPASSAPVSSATPQGVPGASSSSANPGARQPGTKPVGNAVKGSKPLTPSVSVGAPISFGGKPSELLKSDTSQYTKVAEDANGAEESFNALAPLYTPGSGQKPTPSSDQELVFAWVRSNVAGAGRMTQTEVQQGSSVGSFGDKVQNWLSKAKDGTMTPNIEQMLFADIKRGVASKQASAAKLRDQVQQGMGHPPNSFKTPNPPAITPQRPSGVPKEAVWNPQGHNGAGSWQMPK